MELLLSDENTISSEDYNIRNKLYEEFSELPVTFLSKMRHLQPQRKLHKKRLRLRIKRKKQQ